MKRLAIFVLALLALAVVAWPAMVIQPFRAQGARELAAALAVRDWAPWFTLLLLLLAGYLVFRCWRESRWLMRSGFVLALLVVTATAVASRINIFERMFKPVTDGRFLSAAQAGNDAKEMVMAVEIGGQARAYPVLALAYHHIINDTLAGVPLVGTY